MKEKNVKKEKNIKTDDVEEVNTSSTTEEEVADIVSVSVTKVGAMLKEMRLQKGLKVVDISKKLCIRKCYLEAIEESDYKEIPAFPYGVGFIRSYAKFLGLNSENIVELYKEEVCGTSNKDIHVVEHQPEASMPSLQYLLISLFSIVVIYVGWTFFNQSIGTEQTVLAEEVSENIVDDDNSVIIVEEFNMNNNGQTPSINDKASTTVDVTANAEQIVVSEDVYVEEKAIEETKTENTNILQTSTEVNVPDQGVFIEVTKETWIEVKDENKLYISKVLQIGDTYKVPEGKGKILTVGKHDGVNVYINGILTDVVRPNKKRNIALDNYLDASH